MKCFIIFVSLIFLVQGIPLKPPPAGIEILDFFNALKAATDKLEAFPWIKAPKGKARFGTTTPAPVDSPAVLPPQPLQLTNEQVQDYLAAISASLQPYIVQSPATAESSPVPQEQPSPVKQVAVTSKRPLPLKGKVPKQVNPSDEPTTTDSYWEAERKMYPDSFYDEFYMDWLRKRQVEETDATNPPESVNLEPTEAAQPQPAAPPPPQQPLGTIPLSYSPYSPFSPYMVNPFMYPPVGIKVSKAMAQAQVNAALAALNITTTPKPMKIKLKIPIPAGSDMASVLSSGIAGFPAGTTYELSKK